MLPEIVPGKVPAELNVLTELVLFVE